MYRRSKKRKNRNKRNPSNESAHFVNDFTVQEVANNPKPIATLKKKNYTTSSLIQLKQVTAIPEDSMLGDEEVENWYDRDLADFDELEDLDQGDIFPAVKSEENGVDEEVVTGRVYPADLWYILGDHIDPEDIGRFSSLCRDALNVTNSVSFWRKLYFRHWKADISLPHHLQPFSVKYCDEGIRAKVISALYRMYPPFQQRNKNRQLNCETSESNGLIGSTCQFMCNQGRVGNNYCHYVKFRKYPTPSEQNLRNTLIGSPALWEHPSDGEVMLRVTCPVSQHFSSEHIMGLQLASISISIGKDMCFNRLKMEFVRTFHPKRKTKKENCVLAVLEPVICVSVIDWWHPLFHDSFLHQTTATGQRRGARGNAESHWDA